MMLNGHGHTKNFHRQSSVRTCPPTEHRQRNSFPPTPPPPTRLSRADTLKPIIQEQRQEVIHIKKKNNHNSKRLINTKDEDIPLALLAYKKGYTTIYPSTPQVPAMRQDERLLSYVSASSSNSSSSRTKPIIRHDTTVKKKTENKQLSSQPKKSLRRRRTQPPQQQQEEVVVVVMVKETKPKKWFNSLRKLLD